MDGTDSLTVTSVKYCMGIPSVEKFTVNLKRNYSNINSQHGFIPGNKRIGRISSIDHTSWSPVYDILTQAQINSTGNYSNDYTSTNKYYTTSKNESSSLYITEHAYSLINTITTSSNNNNSNFISVKHYYDHDSFTRSGSNLTPRLNLNGTSKIYQITDSSELAKLGSNIGSIGVTNYSNHETILQDHTLLYIKGGFKTNAMSPYPIVNNYNWDVDIPDKYNAGTKSFDLSGIETNDNSGYKWIVFNITGITNTDNRSVTTYTDSGGSEYNYFNIYSYLRNTIKLSLNTISKIKNTSDNDAIGFIRQTVNSSVGIGNLNRQYNPTGLWYNQTVVNKSLETILSTTNNGCNFEQGENWGPLLDTINGDNSMDIFIGLKNNVSLS